MYERLKRKIQPFINIYHLLKAVIANLWYGFPSRKLKVIGVTGTDGKTTTSHLIYYILKSADKKVSMVSSIYAKIGNKEFNTGLHVTTPDAIFLQELLKYAAKKGDEYFVLETTSHGLDQNRNWGIRYEVGVITNITPEHLDYHKTYDKYVKAKAKLLLSSKIPVINKDDLSYDQLRKILNRARRKYYTYGLKEKADFSFNSHKEIDQSITKYNNYNFLAAYSTASILKLPLEQVKKALKSFKLPSGRMEVVYDKDFKVIIDFAHTPNSIYKVLEAISAQKKEGRKLIHVFGSAGLRDRQKRPAMGAASGRFADIAILTEEDYRTENPVNICAEIARGLKRKGFKETSPRFVFPHPKIYAVIINRKKAIQKAVSIAKRGDVIVLTGKSHEQSLARGKREYPWNEKKVVLDTINA
jgi:UDP-N-acetylmuramoyl-L-alanyl-D-glutamate--2,6-diaminopimelate ligase